MKLFSWRPSHPQALVLGALAFIAVVELALPARLNAIWAFAFNPAKGNPPGDNSIAQGATAAPAPDLLHVTPGALASDTAGDTNPGSFPDFEAVGGDAGSLASLSGVTTPNGTIPPEAPAGKPKKVPTGGYAP